MLSESPAPVLDYTDQTPAPAAPVLLAPRLLAPLPGEPSRTQRALWLSLAMTLAVAYFLFILQYWAPADPGVDQNGYLVGGKMLARTGSTGYTPRHALGFVGSMWVRVDATGVNYPKYPNGLPLLYACFLWVFGDDPGGLGTRLAFLVSPIGAAASVLGMYLLARQFASPFSSICAALVMGFSQSALTLANFANSHASCLAFVVWGLFLLMRFWQTGSVWRGVLAGFSLGYAVTIRYTEGLLAIPVALVMLSMLRWRNWRSYLRVAPPLLGWIIPVGYLVIFNLVAMGTPTGYDTTNESKPGAAFTIEHMSDNWEKLIRTVHDSGLFFIVPIGMLGLILAVRHGVRRSAMLWLWLVPGTIVYMAYYWAPDRGVSYLRFFLTLLPPIAIGAAVLFDDLLTHATHSRVGKVLTPIGCGAIVAFSCAIGLYRALHGLDDGENSNRGMEITQLRNLNLARLGQLVTKEAPAGSVLFANPQQLHYLQFVGDYECYSPETFTTSIVTRLESAEKIDAENEPVTQQVARRKYLLAQVKGKSTSELIALQNQIMDEALAGNRRVFFLVNKPSADLLMKRLTRAEGASQTKLVDRQFDIPRPPEEDVRQNESVARRMNRGPVRGGGRDVPQEWRLIEITRRTPTTKPAK